MIRVGTAGWSLPAEWQERFPEGDTHLHRYARVMGAVEIDRTFSKLPRPSTFARWAESVPEGFRFSVKVPREVTHDRRLEAHERADDVWCVFDNTAAGEGTGDALAMGELL